MENAKAPLIDFSSSLYRKETNFVYFCLAELSPIHRERAKQSKMSIQDMPLEGPQDSFCKCRKSKCLKLYCECFARNVLCGAACLCKNCKNKPRRLKLHSKAVAKILKKNPEAFLKHGCNCRKSNCIKNYCVCYQQGIKCKDSCLCQDCKNTEMVYVEFNHHFL